jgi:DNA-binding response OmpR family regulator
MLQTISKKQVEEAAKQYASENPNKYWQEALDVFNFMSDFLAKQKFVSNKIIFNENKRTIIHNGQELTLPKKEYLLALYLYNNSNRIILRDELLENIWGNVCVGDRTVDVHVRKLRSQIPSIPIKTHIGIGYGWIEE